MGAHRGNASLPAAAASSASGALGARAAGPPAPGARGAPGGAAPRAAAPAAGAGGAGAGAGGAPDGPGPGSVAKTPGIGGFFMFIHGLILVGLVYGGAGHALHAPRWTASAGPGAAGG